MNTKIQRELLNFIRISLHSVLCLQRD